MLAQTLLRRYGIAFRNRLADVGMVLQDGVRFAWSRKVQPAQAVEVTALTAHRRPSGWRIIVGVMTAQQRRPIGTNRNFKLE
jgi:hypothetical protein